jgi:hypothetical protein
MVGHTGVSPAVVVMSVNAEARLIRLSRMTRSIAYFFK